MRILMIFIFSICANFAYAANGDLIAATKEGMKFLKKTSSTELLNNETQKKETKKDKNESKEIKSEKTFTREVLAPALQFDTKDYKDYYVIPSDYRVNLKSKNSYLLTCNDDITGINWGDLENIKVFDIYDEFLKGINKKSAVIKARYETYTYIRLYKSTKETANIILSVNPVFEVEPVINIGTCKITPYEG